MILVDQVTKYYGAHAAVRDLSFEIAEGQCAGFLGLNGAGKTTTLRLLSCLLLPTSGRITIRGIDAEAQPHEIRKFIGFLPDRPPVYNEMTVSEYLRFAGQLRQMDRGAIDRRLPEVFDVVGLHAVADAPISSLSHGYKQRVGIAQAIVHEPALLILDEPIQGLDPVQIVEMRALIRELRGKHTILLSTHILSEIRQTCDRVLMLHEGIIAAEGTEAELSGETRASVVKVIVRGDHATLNKALKDVETVDEVRIAENPSGDIIEAIVTAHEDARGEIARAIVGADLELLGLGEKQSDLEQVFLNLSRAGAGS